MSNFFGTAFTGTHSNNDVVVYDGPVYEGYNVEHGGEYSIAMESAQENLNIIAAMAALDVQVTHYVAECAQAGDDEYALEAVQEKYESVLEAAGSSFIEKIKNAIKTLWGKVKAFFASVVRTLDGMTKSTEAFVKKYEKQLQTLNLHNFKYEMHTYTVEDLNIDYIGTFEQDQEKVIQVIVSKIGVRNQSSSDSSLEAVDKQIEKIREDKEKKLDEFRGSIIKQGPLDADDFRKEIQKSLRNGKEPSEAEEVQVNVNKIIADVKGTAKLKTKIDKFQKDADKAFGNAIKMVDKLAVAFNKSSGSKDDKVQTTYGRADGSKGKYKTSTQMASRAATMANLISSAISAKQAVVNTAITEWSSAVKERDAVYKKVLVKAFSHKNTEE